MSAYSRIDPGPAPSGFAVEVSDLRVELAGQGGVPIVEEIAFALAPGSILGLVGESGCGKSTVSTALLGYARRGARIVGGSVSISGQDVLALAGEGLRQARGERVSYVPQDPAAALNPARRVGDELSELLGEHEPRVAAGVASERIAAVLAEVGLPSDREFLRRYPHQLSGGQQQRVCIAMAFLLRPAVIVLDEPTTALDVTTQAQVLGTVRALCADHRVAALYVSHDLSVVATLADRIMVMYAGWIVEVGPTDEVLERPAHPYTRKLIAAVPDIAARRVLAPIRGHAPAPGARPPGCPFAPRCHFVIDECTAQVPELVPVNADHSVRCIRAAEIIASPQELPAVETGREAASSDAVLVVDGAHASYGHRHVLDGVSLTLAPGECLALVGESGSGKTTLARSIIGLHPLSSGAIRFEGQTLSGTARERPADVRRRIQYIFQSPYNSLNPRRTVEQTIALPASEFFHRGRKGLRSSVGEALESVSLPDHVRHRYPHELSGGERQRVAIARALICEPEVLICDEVTSALDVSVQASIVGLLERLRQERNLAMLFVTHNLALVMSIAERVLVIHDGRIVEEGLATAILIAPQQAYTRRLLSDTPSLSEGTRAGAGVIAR